MSITGAPARARAEVEKALPESRRSAVDDAMLLTSELVTNAVRHGQGVVTVEGDCDEHAIAVAVGDDNGHHVSAPSEDLLLESGRGITIVSAVATSWGIRAREDGVGKIAWFILQT